MERGLLPENLPSVVTSKKLWNSYAEKNSYLITKGAVGGLSLFSASKRGHNRRIFSLPHPTFVFDQSLFLERHWATIEPSLKDATGSLSLPVFTDDGTRAIRITPHFELPRARLRKFSRFRLCVVTDVSRFYPSVYTHSIAWAINGHAAAKADHKYNSAAVFGNRLDFIIRQAQDCQTAGLPIGPDTSQVTAEIVLCAVDQRFIAESKAGMAYLRHVDDYWIGGNTYEECQSHLNNLRAALRTYELDINELKTKIVTTNKVFGESWPSEMEREIVQNLKSTDDPVPTLGNVIDRATHEADEGIIKHAIRVIDRNKLWDAHWGTLEHFLAQCAVQFPHSFDYVARVIAWRTRKSKKIDKRLWSDVARLQALYSSGLGRDAEVLWSLWLLREIKTKLPTKVTTSIIKNNGPLVLGFLAHMAAKGFVAGPPITSDLEARIEGDFCAGPSWPLTLELNHLGITKAAALDAGHPALKALHADGASLIDWEAPPKVFEETEKGKAPEPDFAIENFSVDYDTDEEFDADGEINFDE